MMVNHDEMIVVVSNGTVLHKFITSSDVYIDNFHNRIINSKHAEDYETSKSIEYVSYNLKDFAGRPADLIGYTLVENFYDFAQHKGQNLGSHGSNTAEDHVRDSLLDPRNKRRKK